MTEPFQQMLLTPAGEPARIAIVHDFLAERGGAERVALEMVQTFPDADFFTVLYWPTGTYSEFRQIDVQPLLGSGMIRPGGRHRRLLPVAITALSRLRLDYDLVISSSSGLAHLAGNSGGPQLVYCHTPARWLYRPDQYFKDMSPSLRRTVQAAAPVYSRLDKAKMHRADRVIVNARVIRNEVERLYGIRPEVIHPASALDPNGPEVPVDIQPGFYLTPSRLLGYKRIDLINDAASKLPNDRFVIVGDGPRRSHLEAEAPSNVTYLGVCSDAELRWLYRSAHQVVLTCAEDYGLVPAEAASFGTTSVVPDARGFRDVEGGHESTIRYVFGDVDSLIDSLALPCDTYEPPADLGVLQKQFRQEIHNVASELINEHVR